MEVSELVEAALANVARERVEVAALEPADVAMEAVGGVSQLVTELVENAIDFSGPADRVGITGVFDRDEYIISIKDNGVGIPEPLLDALNRVLTDPQRAESESGVSLGILVVARTAARHGIEVRLAPAVPGTTARVTIPARLVSTPSRETPSETPPDWTTETELEQAGYGRGHVVAMSDSARREAEAFLERVFGPLQGQTASRRPAQTRSNGSNGQPQSRTQGSRHRSATSGTLGSRERPESPPPGEGSGGLQKRVPGAHFSVTDDDPSVISGEGAVDIRLNLTRYDEGRKDAADTDPHPDEL